MAVQKKQEERYTPDNKGMSLTSSALGVDRTSLLRKDFKLRGCIGDLNANQKDKLSFVSVKRQVLDAKEQGYGENEIVVAIVRAMHGSLRLKSILEMKDRLKLDTV